ncbi:MAG: four helix bundle protein [Patescibacteria group bacterium]
MIHDLRFMIQEVEPKKIKEFTDLNAWRENHNLVLEIYTISKLFPKEELFGLTSQMRRAAVSITSNIAEGFGRHGYKEKIQFYYLAQGSLTELKNQLILVRDIRYITTQTFEKIIAQMNIAHQLLQGLISKSKTFL